MGFFDKLKGLLNPLNPIKQAGRVGRGVIAGNKRLLRGDVKGAFKQHARAGVGALNLAGDPNINRLTENVGNRIGMGLPRPGVPPPMQPGLPPQMPDMGIMPQAPDIGADVARAVQMARVRRKMMPPDDGMEY